MNEKHIIKRYAKKNPHSFYYDIWEVELIIDTE